jgi:1,4-dihydroxy-2-naphthoyl-CoA hydrolase
VAGLCQAHVGEHPDRRSRSLSSVSETAAGPEEREDTGDHSTGASDGSGKDVRGRGPGAIDGVTGFMGMRWTDPQTVRLQIRPELINAGGLLSGVVTYALVDYCMGSTLWAQTTRDERIATISISINYIQTTTEGEIICTSELDRRNRTTGVMKSAVHAEDGRLLVTAIGSYSIFPRRPRPADPPAGS